MDKETLLNIILKDIAEIDTIIKSFHGQEVIPGAFLDLTENKLSNISEEFQLLKKINNKDITVSHPPRTEKQEIYVEKTPQVVESNVEKDPKKEPVIPTPVQEETLVNNSEPTNKPIPEHKYNETLEKTATPQENTDLKETVNIKEEEKEHIETTTSKQDESPKIIGESFISGTKSVNDLIANSHETKTAKKLKGKPIQDLTRGLGINDRFMFQRELFEGRMDLLNQTLQQLNDMPDFTSAQSFIKSNFNWDEDEEVTQAFYNYIERKF